MKIKTKEGKTMDALTTYQKFKNIDPKIGQIIMKLQDLRLGGKNDKEIVEVIHSLNLPLRVHMVLIGNYSELMSLKFREVY